MYFYFFIILLVGQIKSQIRDRNLLLADVVSWVSKPCRCLSHITPVIPNRHFIPSSLLFFIHNSQLALNGDCFQAELPPNSHRTPRLGSNNGSGDIRDGVVAKRDLAALGPLLISLAQVLRAALVSSDSGVSESGPPAASVSISSVVRHDLLRSPRLRLLLH